MRNLKVSDSCSVSAKVAHNIVYDWMLKQGLDEETSKNAHRKAYEGTGDQAYRGPKLKARKES